MAKKEEIVVTSVPNGVEDGMRKISILLTPHLTGNLPTGFLDAFIFDAWPTKLEQVTFSAHIGNKTFLAQPAPGRELRPDLWAALFPGPTTFVRSFEPPSLFDATVVSYPVDNITTFTEDRYVKVATNSPTDALPAEKLLKDGYFGLIAPHAEIDGESVGGPKKKEIKKDVRSLIKETKKLGIKSAKRAGLNPPVDFFQARDYFANELTQRLKINVPGEDGVNERIDFHQMVSLLAQHPKLMRLLGLIVDLVIPEPAENQLGTGLLSVTPFWPKTLDGNPVFATPKTKVTLSHFRATPHPAAAQPSATVPKQMELKKGFLNVRNEYKDGTKVFDAIQVDPDSASLKLAAFAKTILNAVKIESLGPKRRSNPGRALGDEADVETLELAVPSLRSPGLALVRTGRATRLAKQIAFNLVSLKKLIEEDEPEVILFADDLVRGYSVDVFDEDAARWFPLCQRTGIAEFTNQNLTVPIDLEDGWITLAVTRTPTASGGEPSKKLFLHEALFRWANWSLVVTRPGQTVGTDERVAPVDNEPRTDFKLKVTFEVPPGGLPILRYGRTYRFRARVVDLAGNATDFGDAVATDFSVATDPDAYARLEPISPPALVKRDLTTEGESIERLVIRSNHDRAASATSARHVAAPKIDAFTAEVHGMYDTPSGLDPGAYAQIAKRADGSFGAKNPDGSFIHPSARADPSDYDQPYYPVDELKFVVENGGVSGTPYLVDPLARGVAFLGLPGDPAGVPHTLSFDIPRAGANLRWPNTASFLLRLREGATPSTSGSERGGGLDVSLPKAEIVEVRYSCFNEPEDLPRLALMRWIARAADKAPLPLPRDEDDEERAKVLSWLRAKGKNRPNSRSSGGLPALAVMQEVAAEVRAGRTEWPDETTAKVAAIVGANLMTTPFRKLLLVHAVRQPLVKPNFSGLSEGRELGWTFARLSGDLIVDHKSTAEVDIRGAWTDIEDVIENGVWAPMKMIPKDDLAFQHRITRHPASAGFLGNHEFFDTKYRQLRYRAIATTSFKEYFTEGGTVTVGPSAANLPAPDPAMFGTAQIVPDSETVKSPDGKTTYEKDVDYAMDYVAATIKLAPGRTSSFSAKLTYLRAPITQDSETETMLDVLNSARPAAPQVLYVIPTFEWTRAQDDDGASSKRKGRGLRIYMNRPWWSSGAGELLGVLIPPPTRGAVATLPASLDNYVTHWGLDPLWRSNPTTKKPTAADFETGEASPENREIEEVDGGKVAVVGHEVDFDTERQLWYCDVVLKTDAYFPFIRLALARYQPNSIDRAHLSRVVLADFVQLTPDRSMSMSFDSSDEKKLHVSLTGRSYSKGNFGNAAIVEVTVETRRPEVTDPDEELGWEGVPNSETNLEPGLSPEPGMSAWGGDVTLPLDRGLQRFRLVIREFETLLTGGVISVGGLPIPEVERRLVYVDTVELAGPEVAPSPSPSPTPTPSPTPSPSPTPMPTPTKSPTPTPTPSHSATPTPTPSRSPTPTPTQSPTPTARPDLRVSATTSTSYTITNSGNANAGAFTVQIKNSGGQVIGTENFAGLAQGASSTKTVTPQTFTRTVVIDPNNAVTESNEGNNTGTIPIHNFPDLTFTATSQTSYTIKNQGTGNAGAFVVKITGGPQVITHNFTSLAAGASTSRTFTAATVFRTATADADGAVAESNENNNTASIPPAPARSSD